MKKLPISIQTFEHIIEGDMLYVDKTAYVHRMVHEGKFYFLSRPRRFGKSLLLTTLKAYFEGKKELFKGLYIDDKEQDWTTYPVIHIDYSLVTYKDGVETFKQSLLNYFQRIATRYTVTIKSTILSDAFIELVQALQTKYKQRVVLLIDEYDKPLVDSLTKPTKFEENREILRSLYGSMKGLDNYLRFVLLTGVSRFSKVSVFSGINNLEDISTDQSYSAIVGFTQEELETNFAPYLTQLQQKFAASSEELLPDIQSWYNGFSFDGITKLYNPFSILKLFKELEFRNFWFSTGTPTFLIDLIKSQRQLPEQLEGLKVVDLTGSTMQIEHLPLAPLLFQTGYLAIESVGRDGRRPYYILNYPNEEVRYSFLTYLTAAFVQKDQFNLQPEALALRDALIAEDIAGFCTRFQSFLADIPARLHIDREAYYHSLVYLMLRLVGVQLFLEKETSKGRIDAVLELPDKVYIIEFKFATTKRIKNITTLSKKAMQQINTQKYYEPYLSSGKRILLLGIGFLNKRVHGVVKEM